MKLVHITIIDILKKIFPYFLTLFIIKYCLLSQKMINFIRKLLWNYNSNPHLAKLARI